MLEAAPILHSVFALRYSVADIKRPKALTSTQSIHWPELQESTVEHKKLQNDLLI